MGAPPLPLPSEFHVCCLLRAGDGPCLGEREGPKGEGPYRFIRYSEVLNRAHKLGAGLARLGIPPGQNSFVGIYSRNCTNWVVTALSCDAYSRVVVPLYDTLGPKAVAYAVNQGWWVWSGGVWPGVVWV